MSGTLRYAAIVLAQTTGFSREERQFVLDLLKGIAVSSSWMSACRPSGLL